MLPRELDVVLDVLLRLAPRRCLEWGAGASTLYFPRRLSGGARWYAIEHDADWANKVASRPSPPATTLVLVPPNEPWDRSMETDGTAEQFRDYVRWPAGARPFDLILIDGRARVACMEQSRSVLAPNGVVVLHDANRPEYHDAMAAFPEGELFADGRTKGGGIWVGALGRSLKSVLDLERHRRVWKACE